MTYIDIDVAAVAADGDAKIRSWLNSVLSCMEGNAEKYRRYGRALTRAFEIEAGLRDAWAKMTDADWDAWEAAGCPTAPVVRKAKPAA